MSLALFALLVLVAVLVLGALRTDLNTGLLSFAVAYPLGMVVADLSAVEVAALFPAQLVLTVLGVSLFFELASENGTLERLTNSVLRVVRGQARWLPVVFFALAFGLSALGPGNIAAVALLAPVAMPAGVRAGVRPLLMAVVLCTGANAGAFSPVAVTGSLNAALLGEIGLGGTLPLRVFASVAAIQSLTAAGAYALFRGFRPAPLGSTDLETARGPLRLARGHRLTLLAALVFLVVVVAFRANAGAVAFVLAALLALTRLADTERAIRALPWAVVLLIAGVGTLVNLLEEVGSLALATDLLARYAAPGTINALLALLTGLASLGSSSSGVVMPLFVPLVPSLLAKLGAGNPVEAVIAIDVGSHMVDVSPLSTLGALCLAALPEGVDRASVFRGLLTWGLLMAFVGTILAFVLLDLV